MLKTKKMLKNNALADRLNTYKTGEVLPNDQDYQDEDEFEEETPLERLFQNFFELIFFVLKCLAFGYAVRTVFNTDWKFFAVVAIGFSIEVLTTKILNIFHKN